MSAEIKVCQNCKKEFLIEPEDFLFYEKIKVPPPTWCPYCRFQRRLAFRNERTLYKRTCDLCGKNIVSNFSPDKPHKVFCNPCWWSDKWDALDFGQEYNPETPFFEQLQELQYKVPMMALLVEYPTLVNSEYVNHADRLKNCYLIFDASQCENAHYSKTVVGFNDSMDCRMVGESELCYEDIDVGRSSRVFFSEACENCHDVYFSKNMMGCSNCFGCMNLTNKKYHIFNQPYPKEEYEKKIKEFRLDTFSGIKKARKEVEKFWLQYPVKFAHARRNLNSTGDYIFTSKNAHFMYQARRVEDGKYSQFISMTAKDIYDLTEFGEDTQRIYECATVGVKADMIRFSFAVWGAVRNIEYSMYVLSSSNIFGSIGLRHKSYCILNKQYSKEDYEKLRAQIIEDMGENPYRDKAGRIFNYGEFLPYDLSPFDYNETVVMEYFPLTKKEALAQGLRWKEPVPSEYQATLRDIPDSIHDVPDSVVKEVLECVECGRPFRIIERELGLLRRFELPLPRKCPECRYKDRSSHINQPKFYHRSCNCSGDKSDSGIYQNQAEHFHGAKHCPNEFETTYALDRPEIVYCEACYQSEVV